MKNPEKSRRLKGLEMLIDNIHLQDHLLPEGSDISEFDDVKLEYFKQYGFNVSSIFSEVYEKYNGIKSNKYISNGLYYFTIYPFLVNMNLSMAYADKNFYERLFPHIKQPDTILHNCNGKFYKSFKNNQKGFYLSEDEVIAILEREPKFIIKPSIESGRGRDVRFIDRSKEPDLNLKELLSYYYEDFIIQKPVKQHPSLSALNPSSLNTLRICTFLPPGQNNYVVLGVVARFGGDNSTCDNACSGGGFCKVESSGLIQDKIYHYRNWNSGSLSKDKGIENLVCPSYQKVVDLCLSCHSQLPYMDLIGWDIAIDEEGDPVLIELNQYPDCDIQIANGPMFGEYTDSLMQAIKDCGHKETVGVKRIFPSKPHHDYNFEIGKKLSL